MSANDHNLNNPTFNLAFPLASMSRHIAQYLMNSWLFIFFAVWMFSVSASAEVDQKLFQQTIQSAATFAEPAVARIETVGGVDLVGKLLTATGPTTGVIVHPDGYILTSSFNFVSKPASIVVTIRETKYAAEIVSQDDSKMLTLLKIDASDLPTLHAVPKEEMRVGQTTLALGRTFDASFPNISIGILSATDRIWGRAVQTDAKVSPVNYGGPLIDLRGRCLGILVPLSPSAQETSAGVEWYDSGIGFAVPLSDIEQVLPRMIDGESLKAGKLGIGFDNSDPLAGKAKVARTHPESPADNAGIEEGDVIVAINGNNVDRLADLKHVLGSLYAGDEVALRVQQGDAENDISLKLVDKLEPWKFAELGILSERVAGTPGVTVRHVFTGSAAADAGLKDGDTITQIAKTPTPDIEDLRQFLTRKRPGESFPVEFMRGEETQSANVQLKVLRDSLSDGVPSWTSAAGEGEVTAKVGRINETIPGGDGNFWAYVPEDYHPDNACSLLVWIHPTGDTMEGDMIRAWKDICEERGIILVGPRAADLGGWAPDDQAFVEAVVKWMQEHYTIDEQRTAVLGSESSGGIASMLAFQKRELFRGLMIINNSLQVPPPDNDPDLRLLIHFASQPANPLLPRIEASVQAMRKRFFPTEFTELSDDGGGLFNTESVQTFAAWVDALDRL